MLEEERTAMRTVCKTVMEDWRKAQESLKIEMEEESNKVESSLRHEKYSYEKNIAKMDVLFGSSFRQEEEVLGRIKASLDNPLGYEAAGFALFDMVSLN